MAQTTLAPLPAAPEVLTDAHRQQFQAQGYLAFTDLLSRDEVDLARTRLDEMVHAAAADPTFELKDNGVLIRPNQRYHVQLEPKLKPFNRGDADLHLKVRKLMTYCDEDTWFRALADRHPRLLALRDGLLGPGSILFQDMALVKPPYIGSEKPWHQDNAYFSVTPLDQVLGCWIALDAATVANGCMHVIPGGHRLGPLCHYHHRDCELRPGRIDERQALAVELPPGGVLVFYGMLPHQTPPNTSGERRRALQLHYRGAQSVAVSREEYDKLFAERDGTPASCNANRGKA